MIESSPKFKLLGSNSRYFIITGGRGSSKSFSTNLFATLLSYEQKHRILFTRQTMTSAHLSIIPEFTNKIDLLGYHDHFDISKTDIRNNISGSEILFRGLKASSGDQTANLKSLQGVTTWILDEAEELNNENKFDTIDLSIRQKGVQNRIILIMNPTTKENFVYKRFFEDKGVNEGFNGVVGNTTYIHTTYLDNLEHLDESFIKQVEDIKIKNPDKYKHVIMGGWRNRAEGVVFENWKIGRFQETTPSIWGQDYGFSVDPTTLVQVSIDRSRQIIYVKEHLYKPGLSTSQIAEINLHRCGKSLIYGDGSEPRLIQELRNLGVNIREAVKGPGSITAGISMLQNYQMIIDPDSTNLIKELNNYAWDDKKSGTPIDAWNHGIDAIRYAVFSSAGGKQFKIF